MRVNFENEYYLVFSADTTKYPIFIEDCRRLPCPQPRGKQCKPSKGCYSIFPQKKKVENTDRRIMDFITFSRKKKVVYADLYRAFLGGGGTFVISKKLHGLLSTMDIKGIQLIPVTLMEDDVEKYDDFWYVHIYNYLSVLDGEKSKFLELGNGVKVKSKFKKIKFDNEKMMKINLNKRLVFRFTGKKSYCLVHKTIAEKIMAIKPVGVSFVKVGEFNKGGMKNYA
jgi:hypothetical protein